MPLQVTVPLPHPKGHQASDDFKVSFSFDRKSHAPATRIIFETAHIHLASSKVALNSILSLSSCPTHPLRNLSSDDRLVTHWLRIIGKHAPTAPLIDIELTQRADVLISAKAKASG